MHNPMKNCVTDDTLCRPCAVLDSFLQNGSSGNTIYGRAGLHKFLIGLCILVPGYKFRERKLITHGLVSYRFVVTSPRFPVLASSFFLSVVFPKKYYLFS